MNRGRRRERGTEPQQHAGWSRNACLAGGTKRGRHLVSTVKRYPRVEALESLSRLLPES